MKTPHGVCKNYSYPPGSDLIGLGWGRGWIMHCPGAGALCWVTATVSHGHHPRAHGLEEMSSKKGTVNEGDTPFCQGQVVGVRPGSGPS